METLDPFTINSPYNSKSTESLSISNKETSISCSTISFCNKKSSSNLDDDFEISIQSFLEHLQSQTESIFNEKLKARLDFTNKQLLKNHNFSSWNPKEIFTMNEVGRGAYGNVTKVYDQLNNMVYVKKSIYPGKDKKFDTNSINEIIPLLEIIKINDPNLLSVYYIDYQPGVYCSIFLEIGIKNLQDLINFVQQQSLNVEGLGLYIEQMLKDQLNSLHSNFMCHRDIKPVNILILGPFDQPKLKLADFGTAVKLKSIGAQNVTIAGTLEYMHPLLLKSYRNGNIDCFVDPFEADEHSLRVCIEKIESAMKNSTRKIGLDALWHLYPISIFNDFPYPEMKYRFLIVNPMIKVSRRLIRIANLGAIKMNDENFVDWISLIDKTFKEEKAKNRPYEEIFEELTEEFERGIVNELGVKFFDSLDFLFLTGAILMIEQNPLCEYCFEKGLEMINEKNAGKIEILRYIILKITARLIFYFEGTGHQSMSDFIYYNQIDDDIFISHTLERMIRLETISPKLEAKYSELAFLTKKGLLLIDEIGSEGINISNFFRLTLYILFLEILIRSQDSSIFDEAYQELVFLLQDTNMDKFIKKFALNH